MKAQPGLRKMAYKTFRELSDRWIELSIKCAQAEFFPQAKRK